MKTLFRLIVVLLTAIAFTSCNSGKKSTTQVGKLITSADYGSEWAFTVDSGYIYAIDGGAIFESGGTKYALNGKAKFLGYTPIDPIWRIHPESTSGHRKIDMGPFIDAALDNPH